MLHLSLLGPPKVTLDGQPLTGFSTSKAQALLFYLATTSQQKPTSTSTAPHAHSRAAIASLLWSEMPDSKAKKNLRTILPDLRRLVGGYLHINRQTIAFLQTTPYWLDVEIIRRDLAPQQTPPPVEVRQSAVDLYRGEFLSNFYIHNAPEFEKWVVGQQEQLHTLVVNALFGLIQDYLETGAFPAALAAGRRLLSMEPWSEPAHRQQMLLLTLMGERSAALAQFEACQNILADEFGVGPLEETVALYEQIRNGEPLGAPDPAAEMPTDSRPKSRPPIQPTFATAHNLPQSIELFGREQELAILQAWAHEDRCRIIGVLGIGGQGKSALASTFARQQSEILSPSPTASPSSKQFQQIIWRSFLNAPPIDEVVQEWVHILSGQAVTILPDSFDQQLDLLLSHLRSQCCLLILDNLETLLGSGQHRQAYRPGYEPYGQLLHHLATNDHRSCLLLTSREQPQNLTLLEDDKSAVRFLPLSGLSSKMGRQLVKARGLSSDSAAIEALIERYSGNPLALKLAAKTVQDLFAGDVTGFLSSDTLVFDDIHDVLKQQFSRLSPIEQELMLWLAIVREPISFGQLQSHLAEPVAPRLVLEAMRALIRCSLIEKQGSGFELQNVVMEFCTDLLTEHIETELRTDGGDLFYIDHFALILAQSKEYIRASQTRLLLQPIADRLNSRLGQTGAAKLLQEKLAQVRAQGLADGYAGANILHLLLYLEVGLQGYDFSHLTFRQLHLRGKSLPQTNFHQSKITDSVFTETFGLINTAVFSPDRSYIAAGTNEGTIYVWSAVDQQLVEIIEAHSQPVMRIAFSERISREGQTELVLASCSDDESVAYWCLAKDLQNRWHIRLKHPLQKSTVFVDISENGQQVTAIDLKGQLFRWKITDRDQSQLTQYFTTIPIRFCLAAQSGDGQVIAVGSREDRVQIWQVAAGRLINELSIDVEITALTLSKDGQTLAIGSKSGYLGIWTLPEAKLHQVLKTKLVAVDDLAFSPDGETLASTHGVGDHAVRIWRLDEQNNWRLHRTLLGHTHIIWSAEFSRPPEVDNSQTPKRLLLCTGSSDQTIRVWDVESGQCLYALTGQARALSSIDIFSRADSPDEWTLVAAGYDPLLHKWEGIREQAKLSSHIVYSGSDMAFYAVALSPDGHTIAAVGHAKTVFLWDASTKELIQKLYGHAASIENLAFHPSGNILASASMDGSVCFWDTSSLQGSQNHGLRSSRTCKLLSVLQAHPRSVYDIAFNPEGTIFACVGGDLSIRLWDIGQGHHPKMVNLSKTVKEPGERDIFALAISSDGKKIAAGGNYLVHLWNLNKNTPPLILKHHSAPIYSLDFNFASDTLASGSVDGTIGVWNVRSGELIATLSGHSETVCRIKFAPFQPYLFSSSFDGTIKVWDMQTYECVNTIQIAGPYDGMNISGVTGLTEAQINSLKLLGAAS